MSHNNYFSKYLTLITQIFDSVQETQIARNIKSENIKEKSGQDDLLFSLLSEYGVEEIHHSDPINDPQTSNSHK